MIKLDLGAGDVSPPEFTPLGHRHGSEIFPLNRAGDVDVIRASHVLEHFSRDQTDVVLRNWFDALKPGGEIRVAVPDFNKIAQLQLAGDPLAVGYAMGGQLDQDDFHKTLFDEKALRFALASAGFVLIRPWKSELEDCAALPVSLNLAARKPFKDELRVRGVMTAPRLGFSDFWECTAIDLKQLGIEVTRVGGAFWHQGLTRAIEKALEEDPKLDYVLALDYDTIFRAKTVATMMELALITPDADAIAALQMSRHGDHPLIGMFDEVRDSPTSDWSTFDRANIEVDLFQVPQAHFGLTMLSAPALRSLPKPWFLPVPAPDGSWGKGKIDADIYFWRRWRAEALKLYLAPRCVAGHLQVTVMWPDVNLKTAYQPVARWGETRRPPPGTWTGEPTCA